MATSRTEPTIRTETGATVGRIYNASENPIQFDKSKVSLGYLDVVKQIENEQWGVLLHAYTGESDGYVVYEVTRNPAIPVEGYWIIAWNVPKDRAVGNTVWTGFKRSDYFRGDRVGDRIRNELVNNPNAFAHSGPFNGFVADVKIDNDAWPTFEAFIFRSDHA